MRDGHSVRRGSQPDVQRSSASLSQTFRTRLDAAAIVEPSSDSRSRRKAPGSPFCGDRCRLAPDRRGLAAAPADDHQYRQVEQGWDRLPAVRNAAARSPMPCRAVTTVFSACRRRTLGVPPRRPRIHLSDVFQHDVSCLSVVNFPFDRLAGMRPERGRSRRWTRLRGSRASFRRRFPCTDQARGRGCGSA